MALFSASNNTKSAELKQFLDIDTNFNFDTILPDIKRAEKKYLKEVLGASLYNTLLEHYEGSSSASASSSSSSSSSFVSPTPTLLNELLLLSQEAVAFLAFHYFIKRGAYKISSAGIHKEAGDNKDSLNYFEVQELAQEYLDQGLDAIDVIYTYLEENKTSFEAWVNSSSYSTYHEFFVKDPKTFNLQQNIGESYRTFKNLVPTMRKVNEFYLKPALGADFMSELLTNLKQDDLKTKENEVVSLAQKAFIHLVIAESNDTDLYKIEAGRFIVTEAAGNHITKKVKEGWSTLNERRKQAKIDGEAYLRKMREYLAANASTTVLTTYYNSDLYEEPPTDTEKDVYQINKGVKNFGGFTSL